MKYVTGFLVGVSLVMAGYPYAASQISAKLEVKCMSDGSMVVWPVPLPSP